MGDQAFVMDEPPHARAKYKVSENAICKRFFNFDTNQHTLKQAHKDVIVNTILPALRDPGAQMYIVGHASRSGPEGYNMQLSKARAEEVAAFIRYRIDTSKASIEVVPKGETETLGAKMDDPIDRAVVVIVQSGDAPRPAFIPPEPPKRDLQLPDVPLPPIDAGFRLSGWVITGIAGVLGTVPTPIPGLSAGGGVQTLTLENKRTRKVATYSLDGILVSFGLLDLTKKIPFLKKIVDRLKGRGGSVGPSSFPTFGSEIVVTPWVKEPIGPDAFACFVGITSLSAVMASPGASGNLIVFSMLPLVAPVISEVMIVGFGVFAGTGLSIGLGASADAFHGKSFLKSVS